LLTTYRTVTDVVSTNVITVGAVTQVTPLSTTTIITTTTVDAEMKKRNAQITAAPEIPAFFHHLLARQDNNVTSTAANSSVASALSSACSCLNIQPSNTTTTITGDPAVRDPLVRPRP